MKLANFKRLNYSLIIGSILLLIIFALSIYPDFFATADPYGKQGLEYSINEGGKSSFAIPPIYPCKEYPMGTDKLGRDIKSLIIYGCKTTIITAVFAAFGRLIIALPFAIAGAYKSKVVTWLIKQCNVLFNAFPLILIVLIASNLQILTDFVGNRSLIMAFILAMFGWSKLATVLMEKVMQVLDQDFIEGEIAIGKSKPEIAVQNVIPHMIPTLIVLFFLEIALVLQTIAQIGIFAALTTGGFYNADGDTNVPVEFDWASLLIYAYIYFGTDKLFLVLYPASAFGVSIIAFNLFGEGLRMEFEKRTSRVITFIRKIPSFISPFKLAYEIKNFNTCRKAVYTKLICYTLVVLIVFFPSAPSIQKFETAEAFSVVQELTSDKYGGRLAGSEENKSIAEYISAELESYGIQPYEGEYIHDFNITSSKNIKHSTLKAKSELQGEKEFVFRGDYYVSSPVNFSGSFKSMLISSSALGIISSGEHQMLMDRAGDVESIIIDLRNMRDYRRVPSALEAISRILKPKAVLYLTDMEEDGAIAKTFIEDKTFVDTVVIRMCKEAGDELLRMGCPEIEISVETESHYDVKGHNVIGYIQGSDPNDKTKCLVIGSKMDYVGDDKLIRFSGALGAGGVAAELEIAKKLALSDIKPKNNIIFAFWDGCYNQNRGINSFICKYKMKNNMTKFTYLDIGNIGLKDEATVLMDTSQIYPKNKDAQEYISILKSNARKHGVEFAHGSIMSPIKNDIMSADIQSIMVGNTEKQRISETVNDKIEVIDKKQYTKIGQMLLDTVIEIARGK